MLSGRELVPHQWAGSNRQLFEGALSIFANDAARCPSRGLPVTTFPRSSLSLIVWEACQSWPEGSEMFGERNYGLRLVGMRMLVRRGGGVR
jgi:hypothetical protein